MRLLRGDEQHVTGFHGLILDTVVELAPAVYHVVDLVLRVGGLLVVATGGQDVSPRTHRGNPQKLGVAPPGFPRLLDLGLDRSHGTHPSIHGSTATYLKRSGSSAAGGAFSGVTVPKTPRSKIHEGCNPSGPGGLPISPSRVHARGFIVPAVVVLLLALLIPPPAVFAPSVGAPSSPVAPVAAVPHGAVDYTVAGTVFGMLNSSPSGTPVPIVGDLVRAVPGSGCPITGTDTGTCAPVSSDTTDASGGYTLFLASGNWLVDTSPRIGFGGDTRNITVSGASLTGVNLYAFVELSYTNSTYVLPGYVPLSQYVNNSDDDTQVPVLIVFGGRGVLRRFRE